MSHTSGESKVDLSSTLVSTYGRTDGYYYVNSTDGLLKVTGVAWLERSGPNKSFICTENRVALTRNEQKQIGDSQPFMLPETTEDHNGYIIDDMVMAQAYFDKMKAKRKKIVLSRNVGNDTTDILKQLIIDAKERQIKFCMRHFIMAVLREGIKTDSNGNAVGEKPLEALKRGLREERKKKFKEEIETLKHKFVYKRRNNTCLLVYFVDSDSLEDDAKAIEETGKCNYFCAKSLSIINNDYLETRDHKLIFNDEIDKAMIDFENKFGENGEGCDLRYWGGLKMWNECKKYF